MGDYPLFKVIENQSDCYLDHGYENRYPGYAKAMGQFYFSYVVSIVKLFKKQDLDLFRFLKSYPFKPSLNEDFILLLNSVIQIVFKDELRFTGKFEWLGSNKFHVIYSK